MVSANFTVQGVANPAAHAVAYASTVNLALTSATGASSIVWEIMACSDPDQAIPTITPAGSPQGMTASFVMPADPGDGLGRSFLVRCTVSSQVRTADGSFDTANQYAVVGARNTALRVPIVPGEENYRHATHGWAPEINEILALSSGGSSSGGTGLEVSGTPAAGNVVKWNGTDAVWGTSGTYALGFSVVTATVETSQTVAAPAFTATHTATPTSLVLTNNLNGESKSVVGTPTSFASSLSYQRTTPNQSVTFTLTGSDGITPAVRTATITWGQRVYYGNKVPGTHNAAFITGLPSNTLQTTGSRTFTATAAGTENLYYAYPTRFGTATVVIGGFTYSWTVISTTISVTNAQGYAENYTLIQNENLGVGAKTVAVTVA